MSKENIKIFKFQFDAEIGKLVLPIKFPCKIKLTWKRSSETAEIEPQPLTNGILNFNSKLTLNVNMYFDNQKKLFLEKKSLFTLIIVTEKGQKCAGVVSLDFAQKLNERVQEYKNTYPLQKCPMKDSSLEISIVSHPISEQELDSMSQMTTAPETLQDSLIETSTINAGSSFFIDQSDKASTPTRDDRSDIVGGQLLQGNSISQNILKINDVSTKINQFVVEFSGDLKRELKKLKQKNTILENQLQQLKNLNEQAQTNFNQLKSQNKQISQKLQSTLEDHTQQISRLNSSLVQASSRLQQAQSSKKALQSANLAGESEKFQYLNDQISKKEEAFQKMSQSKNQMQQKLIEERKMTSQLRSKLSNLQSQHQSLRQKYSSVAALKNQLQAERRNNQQQVQSLKNRLQKVYEQMLSSLKDIL